MRTGAWLLVGAAFAVLGSASPLSADDYPARPVRAIIGFGPGAVADLAARTLGGNPEEFSRHIENDIKNWTTVAMAAGLKK